MKAHRGRGVAVAALVVLIGCVEGGPPQVGDTVPDFEAPTLDGAETVSFQDLRGRPFVLNLWATWCAPCRAETPYMQSLYDRYRERGLEMVGITVDTERNRDLAQEFLAEYSVDYIQLHDPGALSLDLFFVAGLPATYIVDANGVIQVVKPGPVLESDQGFIEAIESVLPQGQ